MSQHIELSRQSSICCPDLQQELLQALRKQDILKFEKICDNADQKIALINYKYTEELDATLLELACINGSANFVKYLLENGADRNMRNDIRRWSPIHAIFQSKHEKLDANMRLKILKLLMTVKMKEEMKHQEGNTPSDELDVNNRDNNTNTGLHLAAESGLFECIELLLNNDKIDVNIPNGKKKTVLHLILEYHLKNKLEPNKKIIKKLIAKTNLTCINAADRDNKTVRDLLIHFNDPELNEIIDSVNNENATKSFDEMKFLLQNCTEQEFIKALEECKDYKEYLQRSDGNHTFLTYSSQYGKEKVVHKLIDMEVNSNITADGKLKSDTDSGKSKDTAIMKAASRGYINIVKALFNYKKYSINVSPVDDCNIFHEVIKGSIRHPGLGEKDNQACKDHLECLKFLLKQEKCKPYINLGDNLGNTALHYAAKIGNKDMVLALLEKGAYVAIRNKFGEPAIAHISPKTLETYLDKCIDSNGRLPQDVDYEITIEYTFFIPPMLPSNSDIEENALERCPLNYETEPLVFMSKSDEISHLLKHPVITSFLYIKWRKMQHLFYLNLIFYAIFMALFTCYILGNCESTNALQQSNQNNTLTNIKSSQSSFWFGSTIFSVILILRELIQFTISPKVYLSKGENWLEICIIIISIIVLFFQPPEPFGNQISAFGILFTWAELVLLIGRHPKLSTYIEMLKTVTWSFFKFLLWYSILIIAFALSFYTLFSNDTNEDDFFDDPGISVFKTVVMLTGEFDAASIPFVQHPGYSHVLFILFVFMIAIVLFNLLNGLAISDTQMIKSHAELVGYKAQISLISYIETMLYQSSVWTTIDSKVRSFCCCLSPYTRYNDRTRWCGKKFFSVNILKDLSDCDHKISVQPNENNIIITQQQSSSKECELFSFHKKCKPLTMKGGIVRSAKAIIMKRKLESEENINTDEYLLKTVKNLENKMKKMEKKFDENLQEILRVLKNPNFKLT